MEVATELQKWPKISTNSMKSSLFLPEGQTNMEVASEHQKSPKISTNSMKSSLFFAQRAKKPWPKPSAQAGSKPTKPLQFQGLVAIGF